MNTNNIQFHDKIRRNPYIVVFELSEEFLRDSKLFQINPFKRAFGVRAIEVRLYQQIRVKTFKNISKPKELKTNL